VIRQLVDRRLMTALAAEALLSTSEAHLDEDAINAFVEGRLGEDEASPIVSHLVACTFCRHATAQLIKFESEFNDEAEMIADEGPGGCGCSWKTWQRRVTPSFEETQFSLTRIPKATRMRAQTAKRRLGTSRG